MKKYKEHFKEYDPFLGKDFTLIFFAMLLLLLIIPGNHYYSTMTYVVNTIFSVLVADIVWHTLKSDKGSYVLMGIGIVSVIMIWSSTFFGTPISQYLYIYSHLTFYIAFGVLLSINLAKLKHFTNNAIFGAMAIFITVAFAFGYLYAAIYMAHPHSINAEYGISMDNMIETTVYFSFEVITTLGFGDIYPTDPRVGAIAVSEALFGDAYLAIVIAKFVSLSLVHHTKK